MKNEILTHHGVFYQLKSKFMQDASVEADILVYCVLFLNVFITLETF